jgi:hypothetical protein
MERQVEREYVDEALRRLATDPGYRPEGWSPTEAADFRLLVQCARAAKVVNDLRNMRMLRITSSNAEDPTLAHATVGVSRVIGLTFKEMNAHDPTVVFELLT